jgi:hypothetical protein
VSKILTKNEQMRRNPQRIQPEIEAFLLFDEQKSVGTQP